MYLRNLTQNGPPLRNRAARLKERQDKSFMSFYKKNSIFNAVLWSRNRYILLEPEALFFRAALAPVVTKTIFEEKKIFVYNFIGNLEPLLNVSSSFF